MASIWIVYYCPVHGGQASIVSLETSAENAEKTIADTEAFEALEGWDAMPLAYREVKTGVNYVIAGDSGPITLA